MVAPVAPRADDLASRSEILKVAAASLIGTSIEWYDFFLYGTRAPPRLLRELAADGCGDRPVALDARVPPLLGLPGGDVPGVGVAGAVPLELHPPRRRAVDSPPLGRVAGVRKAEKP